MNIRMKEQSQYISSFFNNILTEIVIEYIKCFLLICTNKCTTMRCIGRAVYISIYGISSAVNIKNRHIKL